ncbi:hypothetical protein KR222_009993, partial [Zaprionus bogoriensis]
RKMRLSEIKKNVGQIIGNLQQLDSWSTAPAADYDAQQALQLQQRTSGLLASLEQLQCERVAGMRAQRKRRRRRVKLLLRQQRRLSSAMGRGSAARAQPASAAAPVPPPQPATHITLGRCRDASTALTTFELLERLCRARGGDVESLSLKLASMRAAWRRVQQENETRPALQLEAQWNQVIFGTPTAAPEQGRRKQAARALLQRRCNWDSYLNYCSSAASSIPRGWVLPPAEPTPQWALYRCE